MSRILFDSHTHIQFPAYDADRDDVIARAKKAGVKMIAVGTQYATSEAGVVLAEKYPEDIWAAIGFHPAHSMPMYGTSPNHVMGSPSTSHAYRQAGSGTKDLYSLSESASRRVTIGWYHDPKEQKSDKPEVFDKKKFEELARNPKVVAIGECGLDYYRLATGDLPLATSIKEAQKKVFIEQIEIARAVGKPLMIHARPSKGTDDAYEDTLSIISNTQFPISKIIHFYEGSFEMTRKLVEAGYYFTFGGIITWKRDYDDILAYIPLERILLETDAPYVAPAPYRGQRNEPAYVVETAKKLAELTGKSFDEICQITTNNVRLVFGIYRLAF